MRQTVAVFMIAGLFFAQSDAQAFLAAAPNTPVSAVPTDSKLQHSAEIISATLEKSLVETALAPLQDSGVKIPASVLARFNPMPAKEGSYRSTIYYDASGRMIFRHERANADYYETYRQASGLENGKIREMRASDSEGTTTFRFHYFKSQHRPAVRILILKSNAEAKYQAFEILADGRLGRLIETGIFRNHRFVRERLYDYDAGTLTFYHPRNVYEKRIYELKADGEAGRPLQYRGRSESGDLVQVRFLYNDRQKTVTCLHLNGMHFATYRMLASNVLGELLRIGTAQAVTQDNRIVAQNTIELAAMERGKKKVPVYLFRHRGSASYVIRERGLDGPEGLGVIGRVLRYVGDEGDLEYFYENGHANAPASVTVLNHRTQETIRFELPKKFFNESSGSVDKSGKSKPAQILAALNHSLARSLFASGPVFFIPVQESPHFGFVKETNAQTRFLSRLLRGPPAEAPR